MAVNATKSPLQALAGVSGCICPPSCKTAIKPLASPQNGIYTAPCDGLHIFIKRNGLPPLLTGKQGQGHEKRLTGFAVSCERVQREKGSGEEKRGKEGKRGG